MRASHSPPKRSLPAWPQALRTGQITPVFCGSAVNLQALDMLLYNMKELLPSAATAAVVGENADSEPVEITVDDTAPTCAYVFKTVADPFVGKLSFIKVLSGKLSATSNVINARTGQPERLGKTLTVCGKKTDRHPPPLWPVILAQLPNWPPPRPAIPYAILPVLSPCPPPSYPVACYRMAVRVAKRAMKARFPARWPA